jgi:hypothetical protein
MTRMLRAAGVDLCFPIKRQINQGNPMAPHFVVLNDDPTYIDRLTIGFQVAA